MATMAKPEKGSMEWEVLAKAELNELVKLEKKLCPVKLIVTHLRPHLDEALAITLLQDYGEMLFPGINSASVEVWTEGRMITEYREKGKTTDGLLDEEQILLVGCGGGVFDEHGKYAPTCAHLVAAYLNMLNRPELFLILKECKEVDHDGHGRPMGIDTIMKDGYEACGDGDEGLGEVLEWAQKSIRWKINGQISFHQCFYEFRKNGLRIQDRIVAIVSDSEKMNKWIRRTYHPEVTIQMNGRGNVAIFFYKEHDVVPSEVFRALCRLENEKRHRIWWAECLEGKREMVSTKDRNEPFHFIFSDYALEKEGFMDGPWWYFSKDKGGQILNGSLTACDVEPTCLTMQEIVSAVIICYSHFNQECEEEGCVGQICPLFRFGLIDCIGKGQSQIGSGGSYNDVLLPTGTSGG